MSCENDNTIKDNNEAFRISKTEILFENEKTRVSTDNIGIDFLDPKVFISKDVIVTNGVAKTKSNNNLWYVPFDKDKKPVLINKLPSGGTVISCDCSSGTIGDCEPNETVTGNVSVIKCIGGCIGIDNPDATGTCDMTVTTIGGRNSSSFTISSGIIVF